MEPATILIVDSEPLEASELQAMLSHDGYTFVVVRNANDARQKILELRGALSVVLLDWDMPQGEGLDLLRWIKSEESLDGIEVVANASSFDPLQVRAGLDNGAYYYLTKPFDGPQLEAIIRAAVSTNRLRASLGARAREAEDVCQMLEFGRFLVRTIPEGELMAVHIASACKRPGAALGLRELIVNAIEHGNLGITYDEKSALIESGELQRERARRLALPENSNAHAELVLERTPDGVVITIRDTGPGFDFCRYMELDEDRLLDSHGRGVLLAATTLDIVYQPPGNCVRVRLPVTPAASAPR